LPLPFSVEVLFYLFVWYKELYVCFTYFRIHSKSLSNMAGIFSLRHRIAIFNNWLWACCRGFCTVIPHDFGFISCTYRCLFKLIISLNFLKYNCNFLIFVGVEYNCNFLILVGKWFSYEEFYFIHIHLWLFYNFSIDSFLLSLIGQFPSQMFLVLLEIELKIVFTCVCHLNLLF